MTNPLILVIGATGTVGSEVVKQLVEGEHRVRALVRDPAKASKFGPEVEIVKGDLAKPETLAAAFAGIEKAFVLSPPLGPEFPDLEGNAFNAAKKSGVTHIVKQSGSSSLETFMTGTPFAEWQGESEKRLRALGVDWTILRPGPFYTNVITAWGIMSRGGLFLPAGNGKDQPIDPRDIAAVAVKALTTPGHEGKTYELTGPELLSYAEVVQIIGTVTGKPLKYVDVPEAVWRQEMLGAGAPPFVVESMLSYFAGVRAGRLSVTSTVPELLGRPARSYEQWAKDHREALQ